MKARKLTLSKMAARFLWQRLLNQSFNTAELRKMNPVFDALDELKAFDQRISAAFKEAEDNEAAKLKLTKEIDEWDETWSDFSLLLSPESYDLVKERWNKQESPVQCRQCGEAVQIGSGKFTEARFAAQQRKLITPIAEAFDRKPEEVDVTETAKDTEQPCQA